MKKLAIVALCLALAGCISRTQYGECIGAFDDKDPAKIYKVDPLNVALAILFFETVFVPVVVVVSETLCPVGEKKP